MKEINLKAILKGLRCTSFLNKCIPFLYTLLSQLIELRRRLELRRVEWGTCSNSLFKMHTFTFEITRLTPKKSLVLFFLFLIWPSLLVFSMLDKLSLSSSSPALPLLFIGLPQFSSSSSHSSWLQISSLPTLHLHVS